MHTKPMSELDGAFTATATSSRKCRKCGEPMKCETWESSCGGYEDYKYTCVNGHVEWVDGIDS